MATFRALDRIWGIKSRSHPWARFRYKACTKRMKRGITQSQYCTSALAAGAYKVWYFLAYYMMAACGQLGGCILLISALCSKYDDRQTTNFSQWFISGGFQIKSRSGPKSRGDSFQGTPTYGAWLRLLVLSSCIYAATAVVEPRVASSVQEAEPGTRLSGPGNVHDLGYDRPVSFTNTQACKRSFRRARMRVQKRISEGKAGETMYRGRLHTAQSLGMRNTCFRSFTEGRRPLHTWSRRPGHMTLRYMTWNCSGLGNMLLPELIQWLDELPSQQRPHVVFLQESHWSITSEWESKGWMHISSGHAEKDKSAGLLTLINIPHVTTKEVRVRRVLQGRLDHIRITHSKGVLDILNCYNQAVSFQQPESHYLKRSQLYRNLDKILCSLAVEHQVLVAGDFNLQLRREEPYVGSATCLRAPLDAQIAKDVEQFLEVVRKHALCALNTWRGRRPHTFTHLKYKTQIDYVFTRQSQATGLAKQAMPQHDFIVGAWRDTKHYPVMGIVHVPKPTWQQRQCPKYDITAILQEVQNPGTISQAIHAQMMESLSTLPLDRYDDIPILLHDLCSRYFLRVPEQHSPTPQQVELKQYITTMWGHYKAAKTGSMMGSPLRGLLRRWRHLVQYHKMRKESQKVGRRLKRERFQTYLEMAEEAANTSNTVALYKLVRKLAPKSRRQQVQIRDAEGMIISELDEEEHLRKHFEGVWHLPMQWESPSLCTAVVEQGDGSTFCITANEIRQAVCAIRPRKAVSPHLPPAPFWKIAAPALGQWLSGQKGIQTADIRYPPSWLMTSVALLQKPGKPVGPLTSLRPIGLQDPLSKAYTSILAQHFKPYALKYLRRIPQYAYLPGRDVMCALMRAVQHCRSVRTTIQSQAYNLHHLRQGTSTTDFRAGLQVSLDLSQAFDTGPWSLVMEAVRRTGAPEGLCSAIAQWIQGTVYELTYKRTRLLVHAGRGVRQGCCLSPIVWSVFTGLLYQEFEAIGGLRSPTGTLSMFADDKHICWELTSPTDLHGALQSLGQLLRLLRRFGLKVNANKSKAILHVQGKGSERIKRTCIELVKDEKHLKVPIFEANTVTVELIPLVSQLHYMGIVLSYTSFEEQTMRHRIAVGRANYDRLRKLVNARKILRLHHRIRLWRCTILPAMTYGLLSTGLTKTSADMFAVAWIKQIRAISNSPVHLTGERSLDLLQRVGLPEPMQHLHKLASSRLLNLQQLYRQIEPDDIMKDPMIENILHNRIMEFKQLALEATYHRKHDSTLVHIPLQEGFSCPECGIYFNTQAAMRQHVTKKHSTEHEPDVAARSFADVNADIRRYGVDGMPQCCFCLSKFNTWSSLGRHIKLNRCTAPTGSAIALPPAQPTRGATEVRDKIPVASDSDFQQSFRKGGLSYLCRRKDVLQELAHHCAICRQWLVNKHDFGSHFVKSHQDLWNKYGTRATKLVVPFVLSAPCIYCGGVASMHTKHKCPTLLQVFFSNLIFHDRAAISAPDQQRTVHLLQSVPGSRSQDDPAIRPESPIDGNRDGDGTNGRLQKKGGGARDGANVGYGSSVEASEKGTWKGQGQGQDQCRNLPVIAISAHQSGAHHRETIDSTRRCIGGAKTQSSLRDVFANQIRRGAPIARIPPVHGVTDVRHREGDGQSQVSETGGPSQPHPSRVGITSGHPDEERRRDAERGAGTVAGQGRGRRSVLALLAMGSRQSPGTPQPGSGAHEAGAVASQNAECHRPSDGGDGSTMSAQPEADGQHGGRPGGYVPRDRHRGRIGARPSPPSSGHVRPLGVEDGTGKVPKGSSSAEPPGEPGHGASPGQRLMTAAALPVLQNTGNTCYQNALLLCIWWLSRHFHESMGGLLLTVQQRVAETNGRLCDIEEWSRILAIWGRPGTQQDVVEFLMFLLEYVTIPGLGGSIHSYDPTSALVDVTDLTSAPIILHIGRHRSLPAMIQEWHQTTEGLQFLIHPPRILFLQVMRFSLQHGRIRKNNVRLKIPDSLLIPTLVENRKALRSYHVVSGVYHLGNSPQSGHYRAFFHEFQSGCDGDIRRYTSDDGVSVAELSSKEAEVLMRNFYLLALVGD